MNIILAPHVDDAVIGCYKLLLSGEIDKIIYFFDLTPERMLEAEAVGIEFGVEISFEGMDFSPKLNDVIYLPCKQDTHVHHRLVNQTYRGHQNTRYYSVDKNFRQVPLKEQEQKDKKLLLDILFPSQKELWENDSKYYLFETILPTDEITYVYCKEQFEAYHYWAGAANFLRHPHRHIFHVKLYVEVFHDDREIEFIALKNELKAFVDHNYTMKEFQKSCEMIGAEIKKYFEEKYQRSIKIDVSEDNENGMIIL